jgi:hypothetical protein
MGKRGRPESDNDLWRPDKRDGSRKTDVAANTNYDCTADPRTRSFRNEIHRPKKIQLSNINAVFAQDRIGHRNVKIHIRNDHLQ